MSAVIGANQTKIDAGGLSNKLDRGTFDARVKCVTDSYEAAALASGSTIKVCGTLPTGARIKEIVLHSDNLTNNTTLKVGDTDDDDRYITATNHGAAATITRINAIGGRDYVVGTNDGDNQLYITTGTGAGTGTIQIDVFYTQD